MIEFLRQIHWLNVYSTNINPQIVAGYFYETLGKLNGCPSTVRGDADTENVIIHQTQLQMMGNYQNGKVARALPICGLSPLGVNSKKSARGTAWMRLFNTLEETGDLI